MRQFGILQETNQNLDNHEIQIVFLLITFFCLLSCGQEKVSIEGTLGSDSIENQGGTDSDNSGGPGTYGWSTETISEGLLLHKFDGNEPITYARQSVRVLDLDLKSNRYKLEFAYVSGSGKTGSQICKERGAVACINATYETGSVYIKVGGSEFHNIQNSKIQDAVDNWKNDGAFFMEENGSIYLEHSGKNKDLRQQRSYYRHHSCPNIYSSAPMLIDDYDPVGERIVPSNLTDVQLNSYHYEHLYRHQGVTHPRTVYAITGDNHLLLLTIDKDRDHGTVAGMSAKEVTKFLKYHFNPQYALNMDGGGSSALNVNGKLVNTPSGAERSVPTYLLIYDDKK